MANLIAPVSGWGSNVGGPALQLKLVDPVNAFTADTGYITSGIVTAANGTTINNQTGRVIGNRAWLRVDYNIGAAGVTAAGAVGTDGNIANTDVLTIIDSRFQPSGSFVNQGLAQAGAGRLAGHVVVTASDTVQIVNVAGSAALVAGDSFSFSGTYLLD